MARPAVFIHGLWLHATSWRPWLDLFAQRGYDPVAPGWPHEPETVEQARAQPDAVAGLGIEDVTDHYAGVIAGLAEPPVIIGHSFGGLIAQKLLGRNLGAAAVAIDPAQIRGVLVLPPAQLRASGVVLGNPANAKRSVSLSAAQFRYGFGNTLSRDESDLLHEKWTIPSPGRPLFEAASAAVSGSSPAKVDTGNAGRGPLLITAGGADRTVPASISRQTLQLYRHSPAITELKEFPDRGHSLTVDSGWNDIADAVVGWLKEKGL
jgi:non-heme chloroperoxidase